MNIRKMFTFATAFFAAALVYAGPKYAFVFIGDGMSTPQRMIAEDFSKVIGRGEFAMNHLAVKTDTITKSANKVITDSAAAATAIACGEKTNNGTLGQLPDGSNIASMAEVAKKAGRKVGIMTTVTIVHATPAGFYAHRKSRGDVRNIAMDLVNSGFDYFAGGGVGGWKNPKGGYFNTDGKFVELKADDKVPADAIDPYTLWQKRGGQFVNGDLEAFKALKPGKPTWCVFGEHGMKFSIDADGTEPKLADLVAKGIELLDNDKGFFIMCEGGKIDYACHANDAATSIRDQLALDDAVKVALKFRETHPDTLIVVTGDHETGGLVRGVAGTGMKMNLKLLANQKRSTASYVSGRELASAVNHAVSAQAGLAWQSGGHTALPTLTTAIGPGSERFAEVHDNTGIGKLMKDLLKD